MSSKHFFKNIKKKKTSEGKRSESPSNSRAIPAFAKASAGKPESIKLSFPKINSIKLLQVYGGILKFSVGFVFLVAVVIVGLDLRNNLQAKQETDLQRKVLNHDLRFWENFISQNQNYRDAYFQVAILEYRLGNTSKAKAYVEKGLALDPNSEDGRKLEKFFASK